MIKTTCLEFYIKLLNQQYYIQEYKSLLVYAIVVLGWSEKD